MDLELAKFIFLAVLAIGTTYLSFKTKKIKR